MALVKRYIGYGGYYAYYLFSFKRVVCNSKKLCWFSFYFVSYFRNNIYGTDIS